ncbi:MAG: hypothetical protein ABIT09_03705 [Croceibacterium sp.]
MRPIAAALGLMLAACQPAPPEAHKAAFPGDAGPGAWAGLSPGDTLRFSGTEPFWGGQAEGGSLTWQTPDDQSGTTIPVTRFAGRNGLGLSGTLAGAAFEMAVSEAPCSDGMSDRRYPFTVTVRRGGETLRGCGWSERHPYSGPKQP